MWVEEKREGNMNMDGRLIRLGVAALLAVFLSLGGFPGEGAQAGSSERTPRSVVIDSGAVASPIPAREAPSKEPGIRLVETLLLPEELRWAFDVRWKGDGSLLLAAGTRGVVEVDRKGAVQATPIGAGGGRRQLWNATRVGVSDQLLVAAAPAFSAAFHRPGGQETLELRDYAAVLDVDVRGDTALILGARRDSAGRWSPDGAMAWVDDGRGTPRPVHYSEAGPRSDIVSWAGPLDLGAVRFMDDGSFVVVPGVEGGVFRYSPEGRLLQTWQSLSLGIAGGCSLDPEQRREVAASMEPRWRYWNQHLIVDDVVSWRGAPALLVRRPMRDRTEWELRVLGEGASARRVRLPLSSTSNRTRARMDLRGPQVAVLLHESGHLGVTPEFAPRILFLELEP